MLRTQITDQPLIRDDNKDQKDNKNETADMLYKNRKATYLGGKDKIFYMGQITLENVLNEKSQPKQYLHNQQQPRQSEDMYQQSDKNHIKDIKQDKQDKQEKQVEQMKPDRNLKFSNMINNIDLVLALRL